MITEREKMLLNYISTLLTTIEAAKKEGISHRISFLIYLSDFVYSLLPQELQELIKKYSDR